MDERAVTPNDLLAFRVEVLVPWLAAVVGAVVLVNTVLLCVGPWSR